MKQKLTIVKVGGAVVEDPTQLACLLQQFRALPGAKILVHGGGRRATQVAARLGIESVMVEGRRVTDAAMLEVVTMVYGGLVNKQVVARLQAMGIDAIGLTGADANILRSRRRPPVTVEGTEVDYGFVGDVERADGGRLAQLIDSGLVPVVAPLTHDGQGTMLNTNADTMAQETARAMAAQGYAVTLVYAFEKPGVLLHADDDSSVIARISRADFEQLRSSGVISGGMVPKIQNALASVEAGVEQVIICSAQAIDGAHGTVVCR